MKKWADRLVNLDFFYGFLFGSIMFFVMSLIIIFTKYPFQWEDKDKGIIRNTDKYYRIIEVQRIQNISVDYKDIK